MTKGQALAYFRMAMAEAGFHDVEAWVEGNPEDEAGPGDEIVHKSWSEAEIRAAHKASHLVLPELPVTKCCDCYVAFYDLSESSSAGDLCPHVSSDRAAASR